MIWIKYQRKTASGVSDWNYKELEQEEDIPDFFETKGQEYWWSDKHRGYNYDIIESPPIEVLERKILNGKREILEITTTIGRYQSLLNELQSNV